MTRKPATAARKPAAPAGKAVQRAETLCSERGLRFTPMRREVYAMLLTQKKPISAYQLLELMQQQQSRRLAPLTVYRALDFLVDSGLIHKLETRHTFIACDHPQEEHQSLYLLCTDCGNSEEVPTDSLLRLINSEASRRRFVPSRPVLEVEGLCSDCGPARR
ncbi:MAG: Fur family transcriptional regulator [Solimonas sp.]